MEPWRAKLAEHDAEAAWTLFVEHYRRLILATIRRVAGDDNVLDAFDHVCAALSANGLARLRRYRDDVPHAARFTTWLVTVVHHLVVDWLRQREGRRRGSFPPDLSPEQKQIFTRVFVEQRSHVEAYELMRSSQAAYSFAAFLRDLAYTYRAVEAARPRGVMQYFRAAPPLFALEPDADEHASAAEIGARLVAPLAALPDEERAALQLFIVEGMRAEDVARTLGWPNAKAVYNRVYRTLKALRTVLEQRGLAREDLGRA